MSMVIPFMNDSDGNFDSRADTPAIHPQQIRTDAQVHANANDSDD